MTATTRSEETDILTASLAHEIACENAAVTGLGILITDREGTVIGSSDLARLGSFHEASLEVVRTRAPTSHTAIQAAELRGTRFGLTLPILVDGVAVGTVGITGSPVRVRQMGPLVRRHTEILLREEASLRSKLLQERGIEDLVRDIGEFDPEIVEFAALLGRARQLGFTLDVTRAAIVFLVTAAPGSARSVRQDESVLRAEVVRVLRERFTDAEDIVAATTPGRFVVLQRLRSKDAGRDERNTLADCVVATDRLRDRYGLLSRAALGGVGTSLTELKSALQDASDVLVLAPVVSPERTTHSIRELRTHHLLSTVGHRARVRLIAAEIGVLRNRPDWIALRATLIAWCETGFSLIGAAERLHIHRNTMIYRIAKIEQLTGRDLHDHGAGITTYLACLADQIEGC